MFVTNSLEFNDDQWKDVNVNDGCKTFEGGLISSLYIRLAHAQARNDRHTPESKISPLPRTGEVFFFSFAIFS